MEHLQAEQELLARLRAGDEIAFAGLVDGLNCRLQALASTFASSPALAEDIVQETWLAVIRGLDGFEGRSTLRTWIFSILVRRARTIASREARRVDASRNGAPGPEAEWEPGKGRIGLWEGVPEPWGLDTAEALVQSRETLEVVRAALDELPETQRQVVLLRDVEEVPPADVCNILSVSETNMRVLLHRGRARIRRALDAYLREGSRPSPRHATPSRETR